MEDPAPPFHGRWTRNGPWHLPFAAADSEQASPSLSMVVAVNHDLLPAVVKYSRDDAVLGCPLG
eukprot:354255-Chlamydomonas_euryale.AAC.6